MKRLLVNSILVTAAGAFSVLAFAQSCDGLDAWNSSQAYVGGVKVQHQSNAYSAKWWTQNENPSTHSGTWDVWRYEHACDGSSSSSSSSSGSSSGSSSSSGSGSSSSGSSGGSTSGSSSSGGSSGSSSSGSSSGGTGNCSATQYVAGSSYALNDLVSNVDKEFRCDIPGWCSSSAAWAYAPGTGAHWQDAWTQVGDCGTSSSSSSGGSSSGSSSSGGSSSGSTSSGGSSSGGSSSGGNSGKLPAHALVGYWHNFDNGSGLYRISQVSDVWDVIVVAFADDAGNGSVAFNLDPGLDKATFIADVAAKRAAGKIVVLSFGGQNGTVTLNTSENVTNFVNSTAAIIDEYGFDGIDIDLESGAGVMHGAPVVQNLITSVQQLKQRFPNMYLSMAPEHPYVQGGYVAYSGIWGAYLPLIDGLRNELDLLHVQLYNNGGLATPYQDQAYAAGSVDMMVSSALMLIEGFPLERGNAGFFQGLRPEQIGLALPSGSTAASSGFASTADINKALDCLTARTNCQTLTPSQAYPAFNGVMTWSINWDMHDGGIFSGPVGSHVHNLP